MGLLARGAAFLARTLLASDGVTVTYTRAGVGVPVAAVVGASPEAAAQQTTPPARLEFTERDYLIRAADLTAAGVTGPPALGDRITETIHGTARTFVVRGKPTEPGWRWSDAEQTTYRVRTKPLTV